MYLACHEDDDPIDATFQHFESGFETYHDPNDEDEYYVEECYYDEDEGDDYYFDNYPEFSDYGVEQDD